MTDEKSELPNRHIRISGKNHLAILRIKPVLVEMGLAPTVDNCLTVIIEKFNEKYGLKI